MSSNSFQSGPPGGDDELPTVRYGPPDPGSPSTPPEQGGFPPAPPGYPQQPGFPPGEPAAPPPKKGRGGLIAIISIIVLVVIVGAGVAFGLSRPKSGNGTGSGTNTSTPTATPTPSIPPGFQKFSNSRFSIDYPSTWKAAAGSAGSSEEEQFTSQAGQYFEVFIDPSNDQPVSQGLLDVFCGQFGGPIGPATTVAIAGQTWQQETCGDNGVPDGAVEAIVPLNTLFLIAYYSPGGMYTTDKSQFYGPMEQTFAFVNDA